MPLSIFYRYVEFCITEFKKNLIVLDTENLIQVSIVILPFQPLSKYSFFLQP